MANSIDCSWKNRLQEYCQKNKLRLPNYRITQQADTPNGMKFQVEVEVDGRWYRSDADCSTKKQAEQSASKRACLDLCREQILPHPIEIHSINAVDNDNDPSKHLPAQFADVEQFFVNMLTARKGRIRKVQVSNVGPFYIIETTGDYRYCDKIQKHHKKNQIYFVVDPINKFYYQKCHDPECQGFRSNKKPIVCN